jgi:hypothetical protein
MATLSLLLCLLVLRAAAQQSCAVPSVGIGMCKAAADCLPPYQSFSLPACAAQGCCIYPYDPSRRQSVTYRKWCEANGHDLANNCPYLDDIYCQKTFPSSFDRDFMCPNRFDSAYLAPMRVKPRSPSTHRSISREHSHSLRLLTCPLLRNLDQRRKRLLAQTSTMFTARGY